MITQKTKPIKANFKAETTTKGLEQRPEAGQWQEKKFAYFTFFYLPPP
jgi:hypothetical protein